MVVKLRDECQKKDDELKETQMKLRSIHEAGRFLSDLRLPSLEFIAAGSPPRHTTGDACAQQALPSELAADVASSAANSAKPQAAAGESLPHFDNSARATAVEDTVSSRRTELALSSSALPRGTGVSSHLFAPHEIYQCQPLHPHSDPFPAEWSPISRAGLPGRQLPPLRMASPPSVQSARSASKRPFTAEPAEPSVKFRRCSMK